MRKSFILLLLLFIAYGISAQDNSNLTGSLLWKVSGNNLSSPSYILGTHHLIDVSFSDSIGGLQTAIENTNQVAGELLLEDKAVLQNKMQQAALLPAGKSYKDMLSDDEYTILDNELTAIFGVGLSQFGQMKPGLINLLYSVTLYVKAHPEFNPMTHEAIDERMQNIAKQNNKSVIGLETVEEQIYAIFDSEPLEDQAKSLVCAISNNEWNSETMDLLDSYYRSGSLTEMYDLAFNNADDPCPLSQEQQAVLLKNRNDNWLKQLPQIMKDKPTLIAVGALHLPGQDGLLYQLEKMGYSVEAVK